MARINGASLICFAATLAATAVTVAGRQDTINLFDLARQLDDVSERALPQLRQGVLDDVTADLQQLEDELSGLLQEDLESIYAVSQAAVANVIEAKHTAIREQVEGIYGPVVTTIDEELQSMTSQSAMEDGLSIATTEAAVLAANTAAATHYHQRIKTASAFGGACENAFAVERAAVQETISSTMTQLTGKIKEQTTEVFSVSARKKAMAGPAPDDAVNWAVKLVGARSEALARKIPKCRSAGCAAEPPSLHSLVATRGHPLVAVCPLEPRLRQLRNPFHELLQAESRQYAVDSIQWGAYPRILSPVDTLPSTLYWHIRPRVPLARFTLGRPTLTSEDTSCVTPTTHSMT